MRVSATVTARNGASSTAATTMTGPRGRLQPTSKQSPRKNSKAPSASVRSQSGRAAGSGNKMRSGPPISQQYGRTAAGTAISKRLKQTGVSVLAPSVVHARRKKRRSTFKLNKPPSVHGTSVKPSGTAKVVVHCPTEVVAPNVTEVTARGPIDVASRHLATPSVPSPVRNVRGSTRRRRSAMMTAEERRAIGANVASGLKSGDEARHKTMGHAQNIRVAVRIRPENERELQMGHRNVIDLIDDRMLVFDPKDGSDEFFYKGKLQSMRDLNKRAKKDHKFAFDVVFGPKASNDEVFEKTTKDLVDVIFEGYNCSVFVYGATGAGKTFTMLGNETNPGLTYRTVLELYRRIETLQEDVSCEISVSYLEVYNENVVDLINPGKQLSIREDGNSGVKIPELSLHKPDGPEHLLKFLQYGNANRTQHPTDANAESSRSHAVFQVYVKLSSRNASLSTDVKVAKLSMIDLAGSERGTVAMSRGVNRLREGANINRSLLALGNCINALADGSKYIPFRDSKLTRLLKDSIGGNCRTVMISNITPNGIQFEDTYNTLKYADRAKRIKVNLKKNTFNVDFHISQYTKLVETLRQENEELRARNQALEEENGKLREMVTVTVSKADNDAGDAKCDVTTLPRPTTPNEGLSEFKKPCLTAEENSDSYIEENETIKALNARVKELETQLEAQQARNFPNGGLTETTEIAPCPQVVRENHNDIEVLVKEHKSLLVKSGDQVAFRKKLELKEKFVRRILERSLLIALKGDEGNDRISRYLNMLERRLRRRRDLEKLAIRELEDSKRRLVERLQEEDEKSWRFKFFEADMKNVDLSNQVFHLTDVFGLMWEELGRCENILRLALPMLKKKHLLLSLRSPIQDSNDKEFQDLTAQVQCTKIQFNEEPGVKEFSETSPFSVSPTASTDYHAVDSLRTRIKSMSTGGLGDLASFVDIHGNEDSLPSDESLLESPISSTLMQAEDQTTSLNEQTARNVVDTSFHGGSGGVTSLKLCSMISRDSLDESLKEILDLEADTTSKDEGNSTFVIESSTVDSVRDGGSDDDDVTEFVSPQLSWKPATPPKKRSKSPETDQENLSKKIMAQQDIQGNFSRRLPLRPSN